MTESEKVANGPDGNSAGFGVYALAATYAAFVVSLIYFFSYGGSTYGIGSIAGTIAFVVAFLCALVLSPVFAAARTATNEISYFLLHLGVGMGIGAILADRNPYATEWHHFVLAPIALTVTAASLAAWLLVFLFVKPGDPPTYREDGWQVSAFWLSALACMVLPVPAIIAEAPLDPSCHNQFRGGRSSARPTLRAKFQLTERDSTIIGSLYDEFADSHQLSVRRHPRIPDSQSRSLCNDDVIISAGGVFEGGRHGMSAFPHENAADWTPLTAELVCFLEKELESDIRFTGNGGEEIERPDFLHESCSTVKQQSVP